MSTSLLYRAFGIREYRYVGTKFEEGQVIFTVVPREQPDCCPECGSKHIHLRGQKERQWQTVPIGGKPVFVRMGIPRISCASCGRAPQMPVSFAVPQHSYTRGFQRYVLELRQCMTIQDVADHLGITWWKVKDIESRYLTRHFAKPKLKHLRRLAIDEISIGKGHRYVTVVLDLESGAIVHVGEGKGADALEPFWKRLRASHARIAAVATDMSAAYIRAVTDHLPDAHLVFDRFHLMKLFNEKLSDLRRELYREAAAGPAKNVLKGIRWLLLRNQENLDDEKNEWERLQEALKLNHSLATAYYLKEEMRLLWEQGSAWSAGRFLDDWCARARASEIRMLCKFADTLENHREGILAWYDYPISTGPLEGTNNKIKTLTKMAYGFRDEEYFRLKLYALHLTRYELVG
jgi:transposase